MVVVDVPITLAMDHDLVRVRLRVRVSWLE